MANSCYMCGREATSREHVPARCFFPDSGSYRNQLITVPSCSEHNEDTSKDDEYVRNIIAMSIGTNAIAFQLFLAKVRNAFIKSPKLFNRTTGKRKRVLTAQGPSYAFEIERVRFDKIIQKIAFALYFHEVHQPWGKELIVMTRNLLNEDMSNNCYGDLLAFIKDKIPPVIMKGNNPKVFQYAFLPSSSPDSRNSALRLIFYEGFEIWITTKKKD